MSTDWNKRRWLLKQYNLGKWIGGGKTLFNRTMSYGSMVTSLSINLILWETVVKEWASLNLPWLSYPIFLGFFLLGFLVSPLLDFKFIMPSDVSFGFWQWWNHPENELRKDIEELLERK